MCVVGYFEYNGECFEDLCSDDRDYFLNFVNSIRQVYNKDFEDESGPQLLRWDEQLATDAYNYGM